LYSYDNFGRLKTVKYDGQTTIYEYDTFGNLSKTTTDTGTERLVATYQYDNMNRLVKLTNFKDANENGVFDSGEGVSEFSYQLDDLGRKDYAIEKFWAEYGEQKNEIDWEYDNAGRLIYEKFDHYNDDFDQTSEWLYDLVGNRLKQVVNGTETAYSYDSNDRLLNEVTGNKSTLYRYDHTQQTGKKVSENGILISETTFEYDLQGRMSAVTIITENRREVTKYEYGTDGIRVSAEHEIWEDGELIKYTKTEYLNDPLNITGYSQVLKQTETNIISDKETVTAYIIGHQRISQIVTDKNSNQQEYYFTFDGHGSTRALTDFTGAIAQLYAFDAYGNALGFSSDEALTEFLYTGEQFDSKIGQQYLRARYYDPATGRFNRLDPFFGNLNDPQSFHKYLYTHADPVNGIDPSGQMLAGAMVSIAMNTNFQSASINFYQSAYDLTTSGLDFLNLKYIVDFLRAYSYVPSPPPYVSAMLCTLPVLGMLSNAKLLSPSDIRNFVDLSVWQHLPDSHLAGKMGEEWVKRLLVRKGYDKNSIIAIQNASNHGIDIVAKKGNQYFVIEVKSHIEEGAAKLSNRQKDVTAFVDDILKKIEIGEGAWKNIPEETFNAAKNLANYLATPGKKLQGLVINVDFALSLKPLFSVKRWLR
jgi:RHS repeat-associated protein